MQDNPALAAALRRGAVVPVFVWDEEGEGEWRPGAASRWWLHRSLAALDADLRGRGAPLVVARGDSEKELVRIARACGADAIYWNRRYEPAAARRDARLAERFAADGIAVETFNGSLLFDPATLRNKAGGPFQVFTPFWRHCLALSIEPALRLPAGPFATAAAPRGMRIEELELSPVKDWAAGLRETWEPGEAGARSRWKRFTRVIGRYADDRDVPAEHGTSELSPHLHFGEISPRQLWTGVRALSEKSGVFPAHRGAQVFLNEVGWREFAYHLLHHFPHTPEQPLREKFGRFPWRRDAAHLVAWQKGLTGYPIVDAGMRQLWRTGWMHNRVRMIVGSFLVKHLRLSWQEGAAWFWDTLVDADLANNTLGWQWSAGCGADAAPYFRVFNPILQGEKFDPHGEYVRRWVPELGRVSPGFIHRPWEAPGERLRAAGVELGKNYPDPIVDHATARAAALAAFKKL